MRDRREFVMWAAANMIQVKPDDDQRAGHVKACVASAEALADALGLTAETPTFDQQANRAIEQQGAELFRRGERIAELEKQVEQLEVQLEAATAPAAKPARGR